MQGKHRSIDEYWAGVILTAGAGRRMAPLNLCRPKALMPVCNVPLLAYQYRTMAALDVGRLIVQTGDLDGLAIKSAHQSALSRVEGYEPSIRWLTDMDEGDFSMRLLCDIVDTNLVVLNCDRVGTYPLSAAKSAHSASEATCTWALTPHLQGVESASWQIGESGRLARYSRSRLPLSYNNTGIVLAGPQFVRQMADPSSGHPFDFTGQQPWFGYPPQSNVFWDAAPERFRIHAARRARLWL